MDYTIELSSGKKIPLYFSTRVVENFCQRNGNLSVTGFRELAAENKWTFGNMISILFCAAEYYAKRNNLPFEYSEFDADDWITDMGGINGEKTQKILVDFVTTAFPELQGIIDVVVNKEKKTSKKK